MTRPLVHLSFRLILPTQRTVLLVALLLSLMVVGVATSQTGAIVPFCPVTGVRDVARGYEPGGIILTAFDRSAIWAYEIDSGRRYPLPETTPCAGNCSLSSDAQWVLYFNDATNAVNQMRLNGTERSLAAASAADVEWWTGDRLFVWTPGHHAYILNPASTERQPIDVAGVASVQPGGSYALAYTPDEGRIDRVLIDLSAEQPARSDSAVSLGEAVPYFDAAAWSPDGSRLAFTAIVRNAQGEIIGGELSAVQPGSERPEIWTNLMGAYGGVRINGLSNGELSWSPDGSRLAFWVTPLRDDTDDETRPSTLHVLDAASRNIVAYCGYSTTDNTPNPPRLIWSPDGSTIAFAGNVEGDARGTLLIALNTSTGAYSALSTGIYPALGTPNVYAWGNLPGS